MLEQACRLCLVTFLVFLVVFAHLGLVHGRPGDFSNGDRVYVYTREYLLGLLQASASLTTVSQTDFPPDILPKPNDFEQGRDVP
ncbi:hypothetical protein BaRGS_00032140 [Batillaria attramentaria]|uniref:Secreted protein n=1 Tax=Batillaria attramentaria TaxID=370345 RepID=A0ABD0JP23_9CAEN